MSRGIFSVSVRLLAAQALCMCLLVTVKAEISLSGGGAIPFHDQSYAITQELGKTAGPNLFHSFQTFSLDTGETATFSAAPSIENVIGRVTGGAPSTINGTIKNTIPGADTYLINPAGVMFGEHAALDVQGGFHASTADSLNFADGAEVYADTAQTSTLSSAPPQAFGFLDSNQGRIQVRQAKLSVPTGEALALTAKTIELSGTALPSGHLFALVPGPDAPASILTAPQGKIQLSATDKGDVPVDSINWQTSGGQIRADHTWLNTSGNGGGNMTIRGGEVTFSASRLESETLGNENGRGIDIQGTNVNLIDGTDVFTRTFGAGNGSELRIDAENKVFLGGTDEFSKGGDIVADSHAPVYHAADMNSTGNGGNITLSGETVQISDGVAIWMSSYGIGKAADLSLHAKGDVIFDNPSPDTFYRTFIIANAHGLLPDAHTGGNILFEGKNVYLRDAISIEALMDKDDVLGSMIFRAQENFVMENPQANDNPDVSNNFTAITKRVLSASTGGSAGLVRVEANNARFSNGAAIRNQTFGAGDAGNTEIEVQGTLLMEGVDTFGRSARLETVSNGDPGVAGIGNAGRVIVNAERLEMRDGAMLTSGTDASINGLGGMGGEIVVNIRDEAYLSGVNPHGPHGDGFATGIYANSEGLSAATGPAGKINLQANKLVLENGAQIRSATNNSASGGDISINAASSIEIRGDSTGLIVAEPKIDQIKLLNKELPDGYDYAQSGIYSTSDSVTDGGQGGTIKVSAPFIQLGEKSRISSTSKGAGRAGQIQVNAEQLVLSHDAAIVSESNYPTEYMIPSAVERAQLLLAVGDIIDIVDADSGLKKRYLKTEQGILAIMPVIRVATEADLYTLEKTYDLKDERIVRVDGASDGKPAYFLYKTATYLNQKHWIKVDEQPTVFLDTFEQYAAMNLDRWFKVGEAPPLPSGTLIRIEQGQQGKPTLMLFQAEEFGSEGSYVGDVELLNRLEAASLEELRQFSSSTVIANETLAFVGAQSAPYIYFSGDWFSLSNPLQLIDFNALQQAKTVSPGALVTLADGSRFVRTPQAWLPLKQTYQVQSLAERDALSAQAGDFANVANSGDGSPRMFFYADNQWLPQFRGGDAGNIALHVDQLSVTDNSRISTESVSGGGGSIGIQADGLVRLDDSQISTSVQQGAGNGGDLALTAEFLVQNNAPLIARAHQGEGGNIDIVTKGIYRLGNPANSPIDASSLFGVAGEVELESPDENLVDSVFIVGEQFLHSSHLELSQCQPLQSLQEISRLRVELQASGEVKSPLNFME